MKTAPQGVLIMAGGTGGHIFPGLAVASALQGHDVSVRWLGASGAMECQRVPAAGIPLDVVNIAGLRGKGLQRWLRIPLQLSRAVKQALNLMGRNRPACAISFGGYAAGPGGIAARIRGVPLLVHEQNRIPGLTNRVLAKIATRVLQAFPGTWPERSGVMTCGNPVRSELASLNPPEVRLEGRTGRVRLLVMGGSQGSRALNKTLPKAIAGLPENLLPEVRHQAGSGGAQATMDAYAGAAILARVDEFIDDMAEAYAWADMVVCRAGALTVSELAAVGIGAVLVPYPHAVDDHQTRNAEYLVEAGAAVLLPEAECTAERLSAILRDLIADRKKLQEMAVAAREKAVPDAAERVAQMCMGYLAT